MSEMITPLSSVRLVARLALPILVVTGLATLLICAPRYDPGSVSAFFANSCTAMPCWQGIRPGVTTFNQALSLLRAHPWINEVSEVYASPRSDAKGTILIYWTWSADYPFGGSASPQGIIVTDQGMVVQIYLTADIPLGDLWLTLGGAQGGSVATVVDNTPLHFDHTALFIRNGIAATASIQVDCANPYPHFWEAPIYMWLRNNLELPNADMRAPAYLRDLWVYYPRSRSSSC
jgi:hypothetical protein